MTVVTARVLYAYPPEAGKKYGAIKLDNPNIRISVPGNQIGLFQRGQTTTLEYKQTDQGYYNLVRVLPTGGNAGPIPIEAPPSPRRAPPRKYNGGGASNDMMIFVTGVVGRSMQSGKFDMRDIMSLTTMAKDAYEACFTHGSSAMSRTAAQPQPPRNTGTNGGDPRDAWLEDTEPLDNREWEHDGSGDPSDPPF